MKTITAYLILAGAVLSGGAYLQSRMNPDFSIREYLSSASPINSEISSRRNYKTKEGEERTGDNYEERLNKHIWQLDARDSKQRESNRKRLLAWEYGLKEDGRVIYSDISNEEGERLMNEEDARENILDLDNRLRSAEIEEEARRVQEVQDYREMIEDAKAEVRKAYLRADKFKSRRAKERAKEYEEVLAEEEQ